MNGSLKHLQHESKHCCIVNCCKLIEFTFDECEEFVEQLGELNLCNAIAGKMAQRMSLTANINYFRLHSQSHANVVSSCLANSVKIFSIPHIHILTDKRIIILQSTSFTEMQIGIEIGAHMNRHLTRLWLT